MNKFKFNKATGQYDEAGPIVAASGVSWTPPNPKPVKAKKAPAPKQVKVAKLSMEKQRRSRINWHELVPNDVADYQVAYERRATVFAMCKAGFMLKDIGDLFGVTGPRIAMMRDRHERDLKFGRVAPAQRFIMGRTRPLFKDIGDDELRRLSIAASDIVKGRDWLHV